MARRVIALMGEPIITEYDKAAEAITPGHYLNFDGSGNIIKHASASATGGSRRFALEREELGRGIDPSVSNPYAGSANYAIGDVVKVGAFHQGCHVNAWIASGQNITKGNRMESAGDGTLKSGTTAGATIAIALETTGAVTVATRCRVEIV